MFSIFCPMSTETKAQACFYYRVKSPLKQLEILKGTNSGFNTSQVEKKENLINAMFHSDIVYLYNPVICSPWCDVVSQFKGVPPIISNNQVVKARPLFVWDADDNVDYVSPFNQSFVENGTHSLDGTALEPGDALTTTDADGKEVVLWEDKITYVNSTVFDIARNLEEKKYRHKLMRMCDGLTCASEDLAAYYRNELNLKNVHVHHNMIIPEDYNSTIIPQRLDPPGTVRIFFQGSQSHLPDWMPLKDAVHSIMDKYPNTKWIFFGNEFDFLTSKLPRERYEFHPWGSLDAYRLKRTLLNVDINLCPIADNKFNRGKSAIKWYESAMSPNLEATLAQNVGPYKEITDGVTGLLFNDADEFVQKLSRLIEDAELRNRLGAATRKWVMGNRLPQHIIPGLYDFFNDLRARQAAEISSQIISAPTSLKEVLSRQR